MARSIEVRCDTCGTVRPMDVRPKTWWTMEDSGEVMRTGALDFCSLRCLARWVAHPEVHRVYALDFPDEGAG